MFFKPEKQTDTVKFMICSTVEGQIARANYMEPGESNTGMVLFSGDFQSCIGLLAMLKNGQFVLYHARSSSTSSPPYNKFISQIKDNADTIWVFKKDRHNEDVVEKFAMGISNNANCQDIHIIPVNQYQYIAVDGKKKTVTFAVEQTPYKFDSDANVTDLTYSGDMYPLDTNEELVYRVQSTK